MMRPPFVMIGIAAGILVLTGCDGQQGKNASHSTTPDKHREVIADSTETTWRFSDATDDLGLAFTYRNGEESGRNSILESLGGGVGIFDYDADGFPDLVFPGGGGFVTGRDELFGLPTELFRAHEDSPLRSVTEAAGLAVSTYYTHGVAIADIDNDGFSDLLVTGYGGVQLWWNQGDGTFREVAPAAGLTDSRWSSSAAWGDLNGDGNVDLYIAHYVDWSFENNPVCRGSAHGVADICPPRQFNGVDDVLYFSNGDGTFRDSTREAGLVPGGKGLGVMMADFDQDHDLDIYVANDTESNFLYWNDGHGHLKEEGMLSGVAVDDRGVANGSMGVAIADYDGDQRLDLFVANYEDEAFALYRQVAPQQFLHVSQQTGITSLGVLNVGFGSVMVDVDADGDPDIVVANGHIMHSPRSAPVRQRVMVLKNNGGRRFDRVNLSGPGYLNAGHLGRGLACSDLNMDGNPDLVFSNNNEAAAILLNKTPTNRRRLSVRLVGRSSNRDAIGAVLHLNEGGKTQVLSVTGGGSYLSSNSYTISLSDDEQKSQKIKLKIVWPSGTEQEFSENMHLVNDSAAITVVEPH